MKRLYADLGLALVALIWGSTFPVVKIALDSMSPFAFNTVRFFIACLFFLPFLKGWDFRDGLKIGIVSFLGYTFQTVGLDYTTATNAGFITSTYVVLAPIISWLVYKDVFDRRDISGVCWLLSDSISSQAIQASILETFLFSSALFSLERR